MKSLLVAALIAAAPALASAQAYDPIFGAPPAGPAASPAAKPVAAAAQGDQSLCNSGRNEPPVGARPASYTWTELWPVNGHCWMYGMGDMEFPVAFAALKAFDAASSLPCQECEGGKMYDSWPSHFIASGGVEAKMAALKGDEKLTWKGNRLTGEITLIGEQPIGRFPCRQYRWVMKGAGGKVVAERTGLQCRPDSGQWRKMY